MYLIYRQDYDDFDAIGFTKDEEYAKEYSVYFNTQYLKVEEVPDKSTWEKKFAVYSVNAFIINDQIEKRKEYDGCMMFESSRNHYQEGITMSNRHIKSVSYTSLEEAERNLDSFIETNRIRVRNKPTQYGGIEQELISVKENN